MKADICLENKLGKAAGCLNKKWKAAAFHSVFNIKIFWVPTGHMGSCQMH